VFDRTLKVIAFHFAEAFLRLAFPDADLELIGHETNVELNLPEERVDFVHRVRFNGQEYLFHLEFQLAHRTDLPVRLFIYAALLTAQYELPVITLVLYLQFRASDVPTEYAVLVGGRVVNRFTYPVVRLWEHVDEIRSGRFRELAPLLVTLVEKPDEAVLAEERELILQEQDPKQGGALLALAVAVASRFFEKELLWRFFREEMEEMRNASFIEDWIEEAEIKAAQEARLQGHAEGEKTALTRILARRFGRLPAQWDRRLEPLTVTQLEELIDYVVEAPDLATFEQRLPAA